MAETRSNGSTDDSGGSRLRKAATNDKAVRQVIGRLLRDARVGCDPPLTQAQLAEAVGRTHATLSDIEAGNHGTDAVVLLRIAEVTGLDLGRLQRVVRASTSLLPGSRRRGRPLRGT